MNKSHDNNSIQEELSELLNQYYDGSFSRMVSEYIRATGMTEAEVDALLEDINVNSPKSFNHKKYNV